MFASVQSVLGFYAEEDMIYLMLRYNGGVWADFFLYFWGVLVLFFFYGGFFFLSFFFLRILKL